LATRASMWPRLISRGRASALQCSAQPSRGFNVAAADQPRKDPTAIPQRQLASQLQCGRG